MVRLITIQVAEVCSMEPKLVSPFNRRHGYKFIQPSWWNNFVLNLTSDFSESDIVAFSIRYCEILNERLKEHNARTFLILKANESESEHSRYVQFDNESNLESGRYVQFNDESDFLEFRLRYC